MILKPILKSYGISINEISKYAQIEFNINYQEPDIAEYFKQEFSLDFDIGKEPYQFGKHTFKNVLILIESHNIKIFEMENSKKDRIPKFSLKSCYFKTIELLIIKVGKREIPVLRLITEVPCNETLNDWLFQNLSTMLSIEIKSEQRDIGDIIPDKLKKDLKSGKISLDKGVTMEVVK